MDNHTAEESAMGPMVWKLLAAGSAVAAAAVANKVVTKGWELASGRPVPGDPLDEDVSWKEALLFAALTGVAVGCARVAAQRAAARYYAKSAGHYPAAITHHD